MAKSSNNPISGLDVDWSLDPLTGLKFSGASVQSFIKQHLGAIPHSAHFDPNDYTMYWFASDEDKAAFIEDSSRRDLVLYSTQLSFSSELFRVSLVNNTGSTQMNVATNETSVELSIAYDVQTKNMEESSWRSTGQGVLVTAFIDRGASGTYQILQEETFMPAEQVYEIDVKDALAIGANRVRVNFVSENDASVSASITYTINLTEMFIEPLNNEWYIPIIEGGDSANYKLGGFRIVGAVNKTLHLDIYSGNQKIIAFEKLIGTTVYDRVQYNYTIAEGFDISSLQTGVYVVNAYLTSGTLTSKSISYSIMHVTAADRSTAQLLCINEVEDVAYNYTTARLFRYSIYNRGMSYGSLEATVRLINGTSTSSLSVIPLNNITTSDAHIFEYPLEWLTDDSLNLKIQVVMQYGNEQVATLPVDNSATFPPTFGYEFYLNASSRLNNDSNRSKFVNFVNGNEYDATWQKMTFVDGADGWTRDGAGRQCLYIPAGAKVTLPYSEYRIFDGDNITIELCYRVSNVSDYNENVITICDNPLSDGFRGIRIKPTNIIVHSSSDTSSASDLSRGTNVMDESTIHFVVTIQRDFDGFTGRNLVTGYVDGCKNFQFEYATGALWSTNADLVIGSERSDVSLYFLRVYRSVLPSSAVQANYINSMPTIDQREDLYELMKSVMDASLSNVDYRSVRDNDKNFFIIEMANGATVPSRKDGWDKEQQGLSTLEMHYGEHPDWDWMIENVETGGQGTTSMNYYLWNLRWRIDKTSGKKANVRYLSARRRVGNSYVYDWGEASLSSSVEFDGRGNHPSVKRITAKINFASSMQSHKIGATRAYTELHDAIGLQNEAQKYAERNDLPNPVVSVYQYPVYGFVKRGNTCDFIGLFTIGPDKNDKSTFGLDISGDIKNELIRMEGTDHSRKMVMFNYPWNSDVQYLASNECLNIVKGANDYDNGWEVSACHGLGTDEPDDQSAINQVLENEFKPAYEVAYKNSTLILGIPLNTYGTTAEATIDYINSHIAAFQSELDENQRMTYANYQFWIDGEYVLYYYDIKSNLYVADIDLVEQNGNPVGSTVQEKNEWFKAQRRARFTVEAQSYWNIAECIYHYCFIVLFGAMDNFGKNTYPYKMATFANGGKYAWAQDDLDSILGIGNAGVDNMPTWMEFQDSVNGSVYFGGSTSVFWNLIHECFMGDYINAATDAIRPGILSIGRQILEAASNMAGGTNVYNGIMLYIKSRFWNNAQNYFPQSAYNADASLKYENAWIARGQEVDPLVQSLGNHLSAEEYWTSKRMIYMMSFFKAGPFGSYADASLGQISFRPQSLQSLTVTPSTELYPSFASGQGMVSTGRTMGGSQFTFVGPFGIDGQTMHYINAANYLSSIGDLKDLTLGAQYVNPLNVVGKKLVSFKIGDETANIVITPAVYYTQEEINNAVEGDDAYGKTTDDIKVPAVTEPNVTTNVPSITFNGTNCLEVIDARNAESLEGTLDISGCPRLREAYLEGTSLTGVRLANGQRIETLHLPDSIIGISLNNLKLLSEFEYPNDLSSVSLVQIKNSTVDGIEFVRAAYLSEDSALQFIDVGFEGIKTVASQELQMLSEIANGKNKDGDDVVYGGVSDIGAPLPTTTPLFDGIISLSGGAYSSDFEYLGVTLVEQYDETHLIGMVPTLGSLRVIYDPNELWIRFADTAVETICVTNWDTGGDGHLSMAEAASVTSISTVFKANTAITSFDEFKYFTRVTTVVGGAAATASAFGGCTNLTSITLPTSITSIGNNGFANCSKLNTLTIQSTLTSGSNAFVNDSALSRVNITDIGKWLGCTWNSHPFSGRSSGGTLWLNGEQVTSVIVPSTITALKGSAFYRTNGLVSVTIPSSVTSIGASAFYGCTGLTTVTSTSSGIGLGSYAFYGCSNLTSLKTIPITSMSGSYIFYNCSKLEEITFGGSVSSSNSYNFAGCSELKVVNMPSISAWMGCDFSNASARGPFDISHNGHIYINGTEVTSLDIPNTVTQIKAGCCRYVKGLTSITIPSTVTSIGDCAFQGCTNMGDFEIPSSVVNVPNSAFNSCGNTSGNYTLTINGSVNATGTAVTLNYKKVIIGGDVHLAEHNAMLFRYGITEELRIAGNVDNTTTSGVYGLLLNVENLKFCEIMGTFGSGAPISYGEVGKTGIILHLGYNGIAASASQIFTSTRWAMIYVGDGTSQAGDEAVLNQYLADSAWASHSSKLATWWSYAGEYKD